MPDEGNYTKAIKEIIKKTDRGDIAWTKYDPGEVENADPQETPVEGYRTTYAGKELRIYRVQEKGPPTDTSLEGDELTWTTNTTEKTILKLAHPDGNEEWQFPSMGITDDLYSSVKQEAAGVQEWMSQVLNQDD